MLVDEFSFSNSKASWKEKSKLTGNEREKIKIDKEFLKSLKIKLHALIYIVTATI